MDVNTAAPAETTAADRDYGREGEPRRLSKEEVDRYMGIRDASRAPRMPEGLDAIRYTALEMAIDYAKQRGWSEPADAIVARAETFAQFLINGVANKTSATVAPIRAVPPTIGEAPTVNNPDENTPECFA